MDLDQQVPKFIFVVGGVMSSVGKGVTSASITAILKTRGYNVTNIKCDMYVNIDAGTMRPTEHGEVFIGEDGIEADQDLGNYERFTGNKMTGANYVTTGQVYQEVIRKERNLEYGGEDVEVVPHVPEEIIRRIMVAQEKAEADITIIEIGGTVGEYQVLLFLEAARIMKVRYPHDVAFVLVSYLPLPAHIGEMKTKPTQYAVRTLNGAGIQANFIIARGPERLDQRRRDKLTEVCNLVEGTVIAAPDCDSIYDVPLLFHEQELDVKLLEILGLELREAHMEPWRDLSSRIKSFDKEIKIAVVGKYFATGAFTLSDSYISVIEAAKHAAWKLGVKPILEWVDSENFEKDPTSIENLSAYDAILVPGGFGSRGIEGIVMAITYAREHKVPYFGLCYGMQLACVEFARNIMGKSTANTIEVDPNTSDPIIILNPNQAKNIREEKYGATMRLGAYDCTLVSGSKSFEAYGIEDISERHRHRYEFNNVYKDAMHAAGLEIVGMNTESDLVEIVELKDHPFFVGVQFHPEFKSRPLSPHPLFLAFVQAGMSS
ncbi:MAG: CTP synthase [Candidatus Magasanikbacteria bacterium]|jgi:CTP synthase|nr:CTP synthase [Candidatus Magasanikbacteria bacterium]MBT4221409.1 CTP synthase [Candidatus Magasanikbacteria bacterium]MBT4350743.1 CTP synthase [Candidatus Magasanikbacteria bacterium]MBT4541581.1 CTP synthase [Candidatus Magasanikbacteria bacterium]MBT6253533.1 CTP synthase [Candidatus Magasanikbacteria bacterium]